jgi:polysaccharide biosynthesis/export protein
MSAPRPAAVGMRALVTAAGLTGLLLVACIPISRPSPHPAEVQALRGGSPGRAAARFQPLPAGEVQAVLPGTGLYRIGPGDMLHVAVPKEAAFLRFGETSQGNVIGTSVKSNGKLYLPILGGVDAAGKTIVELQEELQAQVTEKFGVGTYVAVELIEHKSKRYYVLGDVAKPGVYPVDGQTTLLGGVALAQGLNKTAAVEEAYVIRGSKVLPVSLADILHRGDMSRNVVMEDGDLVFVPHGRDRKVYVVGEVLKPGIVPMERGRITLAEAVAAAGGVDARYADTNRISVFRGGWVRPERYTISTLDLWRFGEDIELVSGDRVVIEPTELASWGRAMALLFPYVQGTASLALSAATLSVAAND